MTSPEWLHAFPDLQQLDDELRQQLLRHAAVMNVPANTTLFRDGDACQGYVMVIHGSVKVQKMDPQGREIILYRVEDGQTCMLTTSCLLGSQNYPAEGISEEATQLAMLPGQVFDQLMNHLAFRRFVMKSMGHRIADLMCLVEDVAFGRMDCRLARLLLKRSANGSKKIAATHQELAVELGTAREVISRTIKDFERRDWVKLSRGHVEIHDTAHLQALANTSM